MCSYIFILNYVFILIVVYSNRGSEYQVQSKRFLAAHSRIDVTDF